MFRNVKAEYGRVAPGIFPLDIPNGLGRPHAGQELHVARGFGDPEILRKSQRHHYCLSSPMAGARLPVVSTHGVLSVLTSSVLLLGRALAVVGERASRPPNGFLNTRRFRNARWRPRSMVRIRLGVSGKRLGCVRHLSCVPAGSSVVVRAYSYLPPHGVAAAAAASGVRCPRV